MRLKIKKELNYWLMVLILLPRYVPGNVWVNSKSLGKGSVRTSMVDFFSIGLLI